MSGIAKRLDEAVEHELCRRNHAFFISEHCHIYDSGSRDWIPFRLWTAQEQALNTIHTHQLIVWLKSRQIGATWLSLAYVLWNALFNPIAESLIFSLREKEAMYLAERTMGIYQRLPDYLKVPLARESASVLEFKNHSTIRAFPTGRGDSYTATLAVVDEADLILDLEIMLGSIKPTIDAGGKLVLVSRINKRKPNTAFKHTYRQAVLGENSYVPIFSPWYTHPNRDAGWYAQQQKDAITLDDLYEQYPATAQEALALGFEGRIYGMFSPEIHVTTEAEYRHGREVWWGCDLGYTNPHAFLMGQWRGDNLYIFAEYYQSGRLEREALLDTIHTHANPDGLFPPPDFIWYDPESPTFAIEVQNFAIEHNLNIGIQAANNRVADGIKAVQRYLKTGRLLIHPRCKNLIREIQDFHYADSGAVMRGGDVKPAPSQDDHAMSAIRYLLSTKFYEFEI